MLQSLSIFYIERIGCKYMSTKGRALYIRSYTCFYLYQKNNISMSEDFDFDVKLFRIQELQSFDQNRECNGLLMKVQTLDYLTKSIIIIQLLCCSDLFIDLFQYKTVHSMHRIKQPHTLFERVISKNKKGIQELDEYLKNIIEDNKIDQIESIIHFFIYKNKTIGKGEYQIISLVQALENITFLIVQKPELMQFMNSLVNAILIWFSDDSEKIKLCAVGAVYNIVNCLGDECLIIFLQLFKKMSVLISDPSPSVQQAVNFLNHTMKALLNDAIFDHKFFDISQFMNILADNFQTTSSLGKQFLLDWIMAIQEITQFQISFYLPLFFKEIFQLLLIDSKNLKNKAEECLKKFLHVFKETFISKGSLSSKLKAENARILIQISLLLIREGLSFDTSLHALEWLEVFTKFFSHEIRHKDGEKEDFLQAIYMHKFKDFMLVILATISDESQKIRKISLRINETLLATFPYMKKQHHYIDETILYLQKSLKESKSFLKVEAIIKWIKILFKQNTQKMLTQINLLIKKIVDKLCDKNATKTTFALLEHSIFMDQYFELFIETLLSYFNEFENVYPELILRQILSLSNSQANFIIICQRIALFERSDFKYRIIEHLIIILLTDSNLQKLRLKLISMQDCSEENQQLFVKLFQYFMCNEPALLILCFLTKMYHLLPELLKVIAVEGRLNSTMTKSMLRLVNLLECTNMTHLKLDLHQKIPAKKAYLSYFMALPYSKTSKIMLRRLKIDQYQSEDSEQESDYQSNSLEHQCVMTNQQEKLSVFLLERYEKFIKKNEVESSQIYEINLKEIED